MTSIKKKQLVKGLNKLDPQIRDSGPHESYIIKINNLPTIKVDVSRSYNEVGPTYLGLIARQLGVRLNFLIELISCTKYKDDFIQELLKY